MVRALKYLLPALLAIDLAWRFFAPQDLLLRDFVLYNLIWALALLLLLMKDFNSDLIVTGAISLAIFLWGLGSLLASVDELLLQTPRFTAISELLYLLFYPLVLLGIARFSKGKRPLHQIEILDALIFGLGFTSIVSSLLFASLFSTNELLASENFYLIFYLIGDLSLLLISLIALLTSGTNRTVVLLLLAISLFSITDFYYLWLALNGQYSFGSIADDGWLFAIVILVFSFRERKISLSTRNPIHPALIAISIFISPILLAISALRPNLFPIYILIPSVSNLLLAFIRITTTLRETKSLGDERVLARTDELTGLANRRRLLTEIESFSQVEGALLLLDLNEFKPVNDQFGHATGDLILKQASIRFSRALPEGSLLARLGGDEFGVLIKGGYQQTLEIAYALHACLSYPFEVDGRSIKVGVSIGHIQNDGAGELLKRADDAMYKAKQMEMGGVHSLSL